MTTIDVTPHPSLLHKIGDASFSVAESISELIANSLDAVEKDEGAVIEIEVSQDEIKVSDNCVGMSEEILKKAVRMAWPMKEIRDYGSEGKSEFGLGMKTACASLGKWWSVETITEDADMGMRVSFDLEKWASDDHEWEAEIEDVTRNDIGLPQGSDSGTVVTIKELKVTPIEDSIREALARAYAPHLRGTDRIFLNGHEIEEQEPKLISGSKREVDIEVEGVQIIGWGALMKKGSLQEHGFHWYRKGQLISEYNKSFLKRHPSYRQVIGELHADEMPVNFTKKDFEIESSEWKQAQKELEEEFQPLFKEARKSIKEQEPEPWEAGEIKDNVEVMAEVGEAMSVEILDAETPSDYLLDPILEKIEAVRTDADETLGEVAERHPIKVGDLELRWRHRFKPLGKEGPIVDYGFDDEDEMYIVTNVNSPILDVIENRSALALINVADAMMRYLVEEQGFEHTKALGFRDRWLITACAKIQEAKV